MAHAFDSGLFVKESAWHGLGNVVETAPQSTAEALKLAGMDWQVQEQPLVTFGAEGIPQSVEGWKALKRSDNGQVLHVARENYTVVQNSEAFSFFDEILADGSCELSAAVSLNAGRRVAITATVNGSHGEVIPGDEVYSKLILFNAHDGSLSLGVMFGATRVVCANKLAIALNEAKRSKARFNGSDDIAFSENQRVIRLRHTKNILENLDLVKKAINVSARKFDLTLQEYKAMANAKMNDALYRTYLERVFAPDLEEGRSVQALRCYDQLQNNFASGIGSDIKGVNGTVWAGYNALTEFATHQKSNNSDDVEAARNRLNSLWFGDSAKLIDRAHTEALALCK
jgi:phage/plasmid-like protein (TIGR03299 family)